MFARDPLAIEVSADYLDAELARPKSIRSMASIDHFDLRSFDLNLLVAFDVLMQERSVTRAATRLKIGQPAMSHSLSVLRMLLQDELFVRVGAEMQPTARACVIATPIRVALETMQAALRTTSAFDPAREARTFRLGFSSEVEVLLVPELTSVLRRSAPGMRLLSRPADRAQVHRMLDEQAIDLAVGCFDDGAQRHRSTRLFEQSLTCVFNADLLPIEAPVTLQDYLRQPHALMTLRDSLNGCLEAALAEIGAELNVVTAAADFLSVLATAAGSPVLATLPSHMARRFGPAFGLTLCPAPLELRLPAVSMVWSAQQDQDPASAWLRQRVAETLAFAGNAATTRLESMDKHSLVA